jgi:phospholipid/cholesterol/gamma-HCH transport system substrate-binding protein
MLTYARGHSALRVGLLSVAAVVSFAGLFFYSTNRVLGAVRSTIHARFDTAEGLQRGDAVLHRGVKVGEVKAIDFGSDVVVVRIRLNQVVPVSGEVRAAMVAADIFGRQLIVLRGSDSGGPALADGDTVPGDGPVSMTGRIEELGDQVGDLLSDHTIEQVRSTLHGVGSAASSAASAASQVGSLARTAEAMITEQREALGELAVNADLVARNLGEVTDPEAFVALRTRLELSAGNLVSATAGMDSAAASLTRILASLEAGEGSAGQLLTDAALYEGVVGSLEALRELLEDVRTNPKRYVNFSVF